MRKAPWLVFVLLLTSSTCMADEVLTFEDLPSTLAGNGFGAVLEQGVFFFLVGPGNIGGQFVRITATTPCAPPCVFDGTTSLGVLNVPVDVFSSPFTLYSFDIADFFNFTADPLYGAGYPGSLGAVTLTGLTEGNQTLTTTFQIANPDQFTTFTLPAGWNDLVDLRFNPSTLDPSFVASINLDNIRISRSVSQTPEPSSLLLLGSGLAGLFVPRRRRRSGRPSAGHAEWFWAPPLVRVMQFVGSPSWTVRQSVNLKG